MSGPCMICGATGYAPSFGGPMICPSCDCGNFGPDVVKRQGETIAALNRELSVVKDILLNPHPDDEPDVKRLHREKCEMFERALLAEAEVKRLQHIIDRRPAINAELPHSYIRWSQSIYTVEAARIIGQH